MFRTMKSIDPDCENLDENVILKSGLDRTFLNFLFNLEKIHGNEYYWSTGTYTINIQNFDGVVDDLEYIMRVFALDTLCDAMEIYLLTSHKFGKERKMFKHFIQSSRSMWDWMGGDPKHAIEACIGNDVFNEVISNVEE
jgi:hypothetical protein